MASTDMDLDYLSQDLIFRILLWLPVAALLRLKLVCKSWNSLIESSDFVYRHHRLTSSRDEDDNGHPSARLIFCNYPLDPREQWFRSVSFHTSVLLDFPVLTDPYKIHYIEVLGSINGIVFLRQERAICLWNPATGESTNLPPLPVMPVSCCFGFGFDVRTYDYKVVCVSSDLTTHVYSLTSDYWKPIDGAKEGYDLPHVLLPIYSETNLYNAHHNEMCWMVSTDWFTSDHPQTVSRTVILSYSFNEEVFRTILLPIDSELKCAWSLFMLRQNVACLVGVNSVVGVLNMREKWRLDCLEIWMLNTHSDKRSWVKLYSIQPFSVDCSPIHSCWIRGFSNNGDFLLFITNKNLCLYDIPSGETRSFPVPISGYRYGFVVYGESLVSLKRRNAATSYVTLEDLSGRIVSTQLLPQNNSWSDRDIPEVVLFHILVRLPVVSLLRFKSVCKTWCCVIKNTDFVTQHHHHHQSGNDDLILHSPTGMSFVDSSHPSRNTSATCLLSDNKIELLYLPYDGYWQFMNLSIVTSFNGIVCLNESESFRIYFWNPATKNFSIVEREWAEYFYIELCFGFGLDDSTKNYKLVRFHGGYDDTPRVAQIYNLSTDSWKSIEILPTFERITGGLRAPFRNGVYCWLALTESDVWFQTILVFDFCREVFGTIPLPNDINHSSFDLKLAIVRDNIACIAVDSNDYSEEENWHCEIWMMSEYGDEGSWTKLYSSVGPYSWDWHVEIAYSKNNEDYLLLREDGQLYECRLVSQELKSLPFQIQGPEDYQVVLYKESLVSIN